MASMETVFGGTKAYNFHPYQTITNLNVATILQTVGFYGYRVYDNADMLIMHLHLLASALFPIWIGAHASLSKPPGDVCIVEEPPRHESNEGSKKSITKSNMDGLTPSDAILFPIMAAITLGGLYLLITWLEDPAILNKILNYYFSIVGVFGTGRLMADALNVLTSFMFPLFWTSSDGGKAYCVDISIFGNRTRDVDQNSTKVVTASRATVASPDSDTRQPRIYRRILWSTRQLMTESYTCTIFHHKIGRLQKQIRLNDITGFAIGLLSVFIYNYYVKAWWLTNLTAFGLCYGTLQLLSPTTFWTGTLVLMGLFVYDIVMVFYTPMMTTVATSLDVPIKLVFPVGNKRGSMLGLGDVVLPGLMISMALRFDLYMHYRKSVDNGLKRPYLQAAGYYGERFWTSDTVKASPSTLSPFVPQVINGGRFSKPYFYAAIVGYILGMLTTLFILNVYKHAQPALLYLVPGVVGALWGTAWFRGEITYMWNYCEEFGDEQQNNVAQKTNGKSGSSESEQVEKENRIQPSHVMENKAREPRREKDPKRTMFFISIDQGQSSPQNYVELGTSDTE